MMSNNFYVIACTFLYTKAASLPF